MNETHHVDPAAGATSDAPSENPVLEPAAEPVATAPEASVEPETTVEPEAPVGPEPQAAADAEAAAQTQQDEPVADEADPVVASSASDMASAAVGEPPQAEVAVAAPAKPERPAPTPEQIKANEERRRRAQEAWERVVAAHGSGESLNGIVTAVVKGGLLVDVGGIRGFLPASQVRVAQGTAIETLLKTRIPLKVIDVDNGRRRIVVSHRRAEQDERRAKRAELLSSLQVGQVREGTVVRLADFGAFVDLGGIDGLIPMRELAFERVEKSSDVVKVGEKLPVEVLRIEEGGKKISLSRKNALPDPWRDHAALLRQGTTVHGKVVDRERGLQVEIAPGVIGSVRESDANPADYELGEEVEVTVRFVDRAKRRIGLSTMHGQAAVPQTSSGFAPLGIELTQRGKSR